MTLIKNYNYSLNHITDFIVDTTSGQYIWVAFEQDSDENCILKKVSSHNLYQTYYNIEIPVDEITSMIVDGNYIYLAYNDSSYIGARYSLSNPLSTSTNFDIPSGIIQTPIDVLVDDSSVFYLLPGNSSGTNVKIVKMSTSGTFEETIDLSTISNAIGFTVDSNSNIWVATNEDPSSLIRVYLSGGNYTYTKTILNQ